MRVIGQTQEQSPEGKHRQGGMRREMSKERKIKIGEEEIH